MSLRIVEQSIFDTRAKAYVNTINCVGVMGAGIAREFRDRYPDMFREYKEKCLKGEIRPGDCYTYLHGNGPSASYLMGLAVKSHWKNWGTVEWIESSLKSFQLALLDLQIKTVNMPLPCAQNGRRGPNGPILGFTAPPDAAGILEIVHRHLEEFADSWDIEINVCIPKIDLTL